MTSAHPSTFCGWCDAMSGLSLCQCALAPSPLTATLSKSPQLLCSCSWTPSSSLFIGSTPRRFRHFYVHLDLLSMLLVSAKRMFCRYCVHETTQKSLWVHLRWHLHDASILACPVLFSGGKIVLQIMCIILTVFLHPNSPSIFCLFPYNTENTSPTLQSKAAQASGTTNQHRI